MKINKLLFVFTCCLWQFSIAVSAQSFPKAGATWVFERGFVPFVDAIGEKWEYMGDSTVAAGTIKKMKVTTKVVNPGSAPNDTTITIQSFEHYLYAGDTIRSLNHLENIIANFGVAVGDSMYTPYYNSANINLLNPGCSDSAIVFQKGHVIEIGTEAQDGISSRYYKLRFFNEAGDYDTVKFTERSILVEGYWRYELYNICNTIVESAPYQLICFHDNSFQDVPCAGITWFDHLAIDEEPTWNGKIFPNPISDIINITNPYAENMYGYITDMQGRIIKSGILIFKNTTTQMPIECTSGIYMLNMTLPNGKRFQEKIIVR